MLSLNQLLQALANPNLKPKTRSFLQDLLEKEKTRRKIIKTSDMTEILIEGVKDQLNDTQILVYEKAMKKGLNKKESHNLAKAVNITEIRNSLRKINNIKVPIRNKVLEWLQKEEPEKEILKYISKKITKKID